MSHHRSCCCDGVAPCAYYEVKRCSDDEVIGRVGIPDTAFYDDPDSISNCPTCDNIESMLTWAFKVESSDGVWECCYFGNTTAADLLTFPFPHYFWEDCTACESGDCPVMAMWYVTITYDDSRPSCWNYGTYTGWMCFTPEYDTTYGPIAWRSVYPENIKLYALDGRWSPPLDAAWDNKWSLFIGNISYLGFIVADYTSPECAPPMGTYTASSYYFTPCSTPYPPIYDCDDVNNPLINCESDPSKLACQCVATVTITVEAIP